MKELQELMNEISKWSDKTFDNGEFNRSRSLPISFHLQKEAIELTDAINTCQKIDCFDTRIAVHEEFADVFMLLLDTATHFGISADELLTITYNKLDKNKKRQWGKPDKDGVVEHIEVCHICGKPTDKDSLCERCDKYYCEKCSAKYNQFTQIDFNCCESCSI